MASQTMSSISTFILAMTLNPEAQRKGQEELDRIIGTGRLPRFEDRASLPYVEAIYREVMRWRPAIPLGRRALSQSDRSLILPLR